MQTTQVVSSHWVCWNLNISEVEIPYQALRGNVVRDLSASLADEVAERVRSTGNTENIDPRESACA